MLKCKIQDKILEYDFMLDSYKILDEDQLNGTIKVLVDNGFFYLGCGTFIDNETLKDNRFHFFKRQFSEPDANYQFTAGSLEKAVLNSRASCGSASITGLCDSLYRLEQLSNHKWADEFLRLEDDFYESIPQRTPQGRTPKQHKLIMSFNKQGKKGRR